MNKQYLSFIGHFAVAWFLCTSPVLAQIDVDAVSESIVRVRAYDDHKVVVEGSGFVVNEEGYVLTNAHLIAKAEGLTVLSLKTGAEVVAQRVFASRDMNLALLHVQGLNLPPLSLSEQGADVGRAVQTLRFGAAGAVQLSHGTIGTYQDVLEQENKPSCGTPATAQCLDNCPSLRHALVQRMRGCRRHQSTRSGQRLVAVSESETQRDYFCLAQRRHNSCARRPRNRTYSG